LILSHIFIIHYRLLWNCTG